MHNYKKMEKLLEKKKKNFMAQLGVGWGVGCKILWLKFSFYFLVFPYHWVPSIYTGMYTRISLIRQEYWRIVPAQRMSRT